MAFHDSVKSLYIDPEFEVFRSGKAILDTLRLNLAGEKYLPSQETQRHQ